jgi:hypothetical protein
MCCAVVCVPQVKLATVSLAVPNQPGQQQQQALRAAVDRGMALARGTLMAQ